MRRRKRQWQIQTRRWKERQMMKKRRRCIGEREKGRYRHGEGGRQIMEKRDGILEKLWKETMADTDMEMGSDRCRKSRKKT